jgi:hypothetical protein
VRLSRRIVITSPAVAIAVLVPAAVAVAMPTHAADPASTARAIARERATAPHALPTARAVASIGTPAAPWPDGPTWATARAVARHQVASFGPVRSTVPTASTPPPHPASAAQVVARDPAHTFRALRPIAPSIASTPAATSRRDGPTWAAALAAGTLAAAVAAGLGLVAGRRSVRVRID